MEKRCATSQGCNFKNLAVDYPLQAIEFFAHTVYPKIEGTPKVTLLRQEQQKESLSQYHRELDVPILLLEWQTKQNKSNRTGQAAKHKSERTQTEKSIVIFAIEHESNPYKFDPIRLAHYCLDLARQQALQGVLNLESERSKQGKYLEFIEHYAKLTQEDAIELLRQYPQEGENVTTYIQQQIQRNREEVAIYRQQLQQVQQQAEQSERSVLMRLVARRFGEIPEAIIERIKAAKTQQLEQWLDNFVDAKKLEDVFL